MKVEAMSKYHQFVWTVLTGLQEGERIIGADLQARAGIEDRRFLYQVVNDLRNNDYLLGSSKTSVNGGYFEIRDENDLNRTLNDLRNSAYSLLETAKRMELNFYKNELNEEGEDKE